MARKLDKTLQDAVKAAVFRVGSQAELARRSGIPQGNIAKYVSGSIHNMNEQTYNKLLPFLELDENHSLTQAGRNPLTQSLNVLFEQLNCREQLHLISLAGTLLDETRAEKRGGRLTDQELERLSAKGISIKRDVLGLVIDINCSGMCWLLNVIASRKTSGRLLSERLFKELLAADPQSRDARELRINVFKVPVYERHIFQYAIYLDGTPPALYTTFLSKNISSEL